MRHLPTKRWTLELLALAALASITFPALAALEVTGAWARATAPGQEVGAAYLNLKSDQATTLTSVTSPTAEVVEIHEMSMKNGIMKMRMKKTLPLPAGTLVKLEPESLHLMLIGLKRPLRTGEFVDLTLTIKNAKGQKSLQTVRIPVKPGE